MSVLFVFFFSPFPKRLTLRLLGSAESIKRASGKFVREKTDQLVFLAAEIKNKKIHTVSLLEEKTATFPKKKKKKKKKNCGGLFSIVRDFWVLVATVGVWKKWNLRFGKVWKKYGIFFSVVAADPGERINPRPTFIPRAQPHAQSLFLFPIVFGIIII